MNFINKYTLSNINVKNKKVLLRLDLTTPIDDNRVVDDINIKRNLKSIQKLLNENCGIIILSNNDSNSLELVAKKIQELLPINKVLFINENYGDNVKNACNMLRNNEILILENFEFNELDRLNDNGLSIFLADLAEIYVFDALSLAHLKYSSIYGVGKFIKRKCLGYLIETEINNLKKLLFTTKTLTMMFGGNRLRHKINYFNYLFSRATNVIIGGEIAYNFLKASGHRVFHPSIEEEMVNKTMESMRTSKAKLYLMNNIVGASDLNNINVKEEKVNGDILGFDVGNIFLKKISEVLNNSDLILFNGVFGIIEQEQFQKGTIEIFNELKSLTAKGHYTFICGTNTVNSIRALGFKDSDFSYISIGKDNVFKLISYEILPIMNIIPNAEK
ncbi:MAG: phosphoglycerate kinase [Mycoplasmataceae bacterium]|nr:phosphoglycerate kinase [Mycoplasmataceae bacterium]